MNDEKLAWFQLLRGLNVAADAAAAQCPYCHRAPNGCRYCAPVRSAARLIDNARYPPTTLAAPPNPVEETIP